MWTPQQTFLRVTVYNVKKQMLGKGSPIRLAYAMIPFSALRNGYRNVSMRDANGCKIAFCKMLWHVRTSHTHLPPLQPLPSSP